MTLEGGKPLVENSDEVGWTAAAFDYYAEMGRNFAGRVIPPVESSQLALVLKEPLGVVGCIVPWNYPLLLLAWKVAPALAAGNAIVAKPSELTPLSTLMLAGCFDHFPAGVVNIVAGAGDVGEALVRDERVDCVAFTGSVATGKRVASICAERVARVNLEMGGKDPFIVCADVAADVGVAARGGAWAAYLNAGQVCTSAERFYVAREVYDDFVSAFVEHAQSLRVGDPLGRRHRRRADGLGRPARQGRRRSSRRRWRRARRCSPAATAPATSAGTSSLPRSSPAPPRTPSCCARRPSARWRRSCRSTSLDEAIALANSTPFGLGANVYTRDLETALRCVREIRSGTVWVNDPLTDNDAGPFGGMKQSGFGRELGSGGSGGLPGDQARAHRDAHRGQGVVVPLRGRRSRRRRRRVAQRLSAAQPAARASASEKAVSSSSAASPPPRVSTSSSANTISARSSAARSACLARATVFFASHGGAFSAAATCWSGMPRSSSTAALWTSRSRRTIGYISRPGRSPCASSSSASRSVAVRSRPTSASARS